MDDHLYDAGATGAAAQVHARVFDFILQKQVQLPAQLLQKLSHLDIVTQAHVVTYVNLYVVVVQLSCLHSP